MSQKCIDCLYCISPNSFFNYYTRGLEPLYRYRCASMCKTIDNDFKPVFIEKSDVYRFNNCGYYHRIDVQEILRGLRK